jgi:hypothetical protein
MKTKQEENWKRVVIIILASIGLLTSLSLLGIDIKFPDQTLSTVGNHSCWANNFCWLPDSAEVCPCMATLPIILWLLLIIVILFFLILFLKWYVLRWYVSIRNEEKRNKIFCFICRKEITNWQLFFQRAGHGFIGDYHKKCMKEKTK